MKKYKSTFLLGKVVSVASDHILIDIPELELQNIKVTKIGIPYFNSADEGIRIPHIRKNEAVLVFFYVIANDILSDPIIFPVVDLSQLKSKEMKIRAESKIEIMTKERESIELKLDNSTFLTQAVRYDALIEIISNIFKIFLQHQHLTSVPGNPTIIDPSSISLYMQKINPDTAMLAKGIIKEALKSKAVKLD